MPHGPLEEGRGGAAAGDVTRGGRRRTGRGAAGSSAGSATPTPESFDGRFNFCRIAFSGSSMGDGGGWSVDYPRADINLSIRLSELTRTQVSTDPSGEPNHLVVRLTDPELFQCPFIMMTEVGRAYFSPEEALKLREYLLKGGFLWADDFWGSYAWDNWASEFSKVLPPAEYPMRDLPRESSAVPHPVHRQPGAADPVDQPLGGLRRHVGARRRQRGARTPAASPTPRAGCSRSSPTTPTSATRGSARATTGTTSTRSRSTATRSASTCCCTR